MSRIPHNGRWWPLVWWTVALTAVWGGLMWRHAGRSDDTWLLLGIGIIYQAVVLVMLIGTRQWKLRALGLLATMEADALLYLTASWVGLAWLQASPRAVDNLIRAGFLFGGLLLLIGLIDWFGDMPMIAERRKRPTGRSDRAMERTADATERTAVATERIAQTGELTEQREADGQR